MRTFLLTIALLLAAANLVSAKVRVRIVVQIASILMHSGATTEEAKSQVERSLREGMEARLNSTERYAVTDSGMIDLVLNVSCIMLGPENRGIACHSEVSYSPYKDSSLYTSVERAESIAAGPTDTAFVVEALMHHFINGTTDAVLAERKGFMRQSVQSLCASHPEECKAPAK